MGFTRALYIPFDHLHREHGALATADPKRDRIILVESERMRSERNWHPERLFFLISSARHFVETLRHEGFTVDYLKVSTTREGISNFLAENPNLELHATNQSSFRLQRTLEELGASFTDNDFFLTSREIFEEWAARQKSYLMENFYREQRKRLNHYASAFLSMGSR